MIAQLQVLNPTGGEVRVDGWGDGHYGASRDGGARRHLGEDRLCLCRQPVVAPLAGDPWRPSRPYGDGGPGDDGILLRCVAAGQVVGVRLFYVRPLKEIAWRMPVQAGQVIGEALSIASRYNARAADVDRLGLMLDHVHLELRVWATKTRIEPVVLPWNG